MNHTLPEVDAYIDQSAEFAQPILIKLRRLFHQACPEIEESIKWSSPFFEYKGIVGNMTAFKNHVSYGFWKAGLMSDPEGILEQAGNTQMAVLEASSVEDLPSDEVLVSYIQEAVQLNEQGIKVPRPQTRKSKPQELQIPEDLIAALNANAAAKETFEAFSFSHRKEYVEWIVEAKRESTRAKRLASTIEWLNEGKPRNWKYMKEYQ